MWTADDISDVKMARDLPFYKNKYKKGHGKINYNTATTTTTTTTNNNNNIDNTNSIYFRFKV